jgi:hypothetical protein
MTPRQLEEHNKIQKKASQTQKDAFLKAFEASWPNVTKAAKTADISRRRVYDWLNEDTAFKEAFDDIVDAKLDELEEGLKRASQEKAGWYFMLSLLKSYRPKRWGDRAKVEHTGGVKYEIFHSIPEPRSWSEELEQGKMSRD